MTEHKYYNIPSYQSTPPVGSRRAKVEQKKLLNQTLVLTGLSLVILLLFLFVVIPNVIRFFGSGKGTSSLNSDSDVPPQVPLISAPAPATSSAEIVLKGFNEAGNTVVVLNNTAEVKRDAVKDDGTFTISVPLQEGDNHLTAFAINAKGKESTTTSEYLVKLDVTPPKLDIKEPQDKQAIQGKKNQTLTVKGVSEAGTRIYLNDRLVFSKEDGTFSSTYRLQTGDNTLHFKAIDEAGNTTEKEISVTFAE